MKLNWVSSVQGEEILEMVGQATKYHLVTITTWQMIEYFLALQTFMCMWVVKFWIQKKIEFRQIKYKKCPNLSNVHQLKSI